MFDANLARSLVARLADLYPDSSHVSALGGAPADEVIWEHAKVNEFVIVSKDSDFYRMSVSWGSPPKVIWLRIGNGTTSFAEQILRDRARDIQGFVDDGEAALLIIETP